jgi:PII-like signaling protein
VYRGILGYGAKGHTHQQNFFHTSRDLPIMIAVVETEEKLSRAADAVEEMLQDGLIAVSDVDMVRLLHPHSLSEATPGATDAKLPAS